MNFSGLYCLIANIRDEHPEIDKKNIRKIEVVCFNKKDYLSVSFTDGTAKTYELFEKTICEGR